MRHFLSVANLSKNELNALIKDAMKIKKSPRKFSRTLEEKSILLIFETVSLRTKLSFEVAMTQLGGHAIFYDIAESTLGKKESIKEFAGSASRYVDGIAARVFDHNALEEMAKFSSVPVINAMTNYEHPCQILGDLLTIYERFGRFRGLKLAYFGDGFNNVTHSLLYGCSMTGIDITVACPKGKEFEPLGDVMKKSLQFASQSSVTITRDAKEAAEGADVIYTDSWMSYHVPKNKEENRMHIFHPYQVNFDIMKIAKKDAVFMHCLPAKRGHEVTDGVIDSKQSVIFDQAENRAHAQKALLLKMLKN